MSNSNKAEIHVLIGPKGCGKTYRLERLIRRERAVIFCDPTKEFEGGQVVTCPSDLAYRMATRDKRKKTHIAWRGARGMKPSALMQWASVIAKATPDRIMIAANETGLLIPRAKPLCSIVQEVVVAGRHCNVPLMATGQVYSDVHPVLRGNADYVDYFATREHNTLDHIRKTGGKTASDIMDALEKYEFCQITPREIPRHMKKT